MSAIYVVWERELLRFRRARSRLISSLLLPLFWLVLFGLGFSAARFPGMPADYLDFVTPGIIGFALLFNSLYAGISVLWDRETGFLKELLATPARRTSLILGKAFGGATTSILQGLLLLLLAFLIGSHAPDILGFLRAFLLMILIALTFVGLGITLALSLSDLQGFEMIMRLLVMPLFFASGSLSPLNTLPVWLRALAYINPLTYGVDALRSFTLGLHVFPVGLDLAVLGGCTLIFTILSVEVFKRSSRR